MTDFGSYIKEFIKETKALRKGMNYITFLNENGVEWEPKVVIAAFHLAYLDACRTFKKGQEKLIDYITKAEESKENDDPNVECIVRISKGIFAYITEGSEDFDDKHKEWCEELKKQYGMTFGQAQKIINMTFKYLYCLFYGKDNDYMERFKSCHMPLDSIMLEWLVRQYDNTDEKIVKSYMSAWSAINKYKYDSDDENYSSNKKYDYVFYVKKIKELCNKEKSFPLKLDFENWRSMQNILAAEAFIKAYNNERDISQKDESELLKIVMEEATERINKLK